MLALLADAAPAEVAVRRRRLEHALTVFDAATVTTTHGFCQQVLTALGTAGDHDTGAVLMEGIGDLVTEVADDLYLRKWGAPGSAAADMTRAEFLALATAAATDPATELLPAPSADGLPGQRARIAAAVRAEVDRRKRRQQLIDYDDMLTRLAATLTDPESGPVAKARLRARYRVVLVDEFQDTDPVQWTILREAFHGHRTLVLIGDPKQAIYGFRGADVHAYLDARESASVVRTLPTNHRSDASLLAGMAAVFGGAALGDERIRVLPVEAAHEGRLVEGVVPLQLRVRAARRPAADQERHAEHRPRPATSSPATWPTGWSRCCRAAASYDRATAARSDLSRPATSPCWCARTARPSSCRPRCRPPGSPSSSPAAPASSPPPLPPSGSGCSRRWSSRTAPPASAGGAHLLRRQGRGRARRGRRDVRRRPRPQAAGLGRRCSPSAGVAALFEAVSLDLAAAARGSSARSAANACSPTCDTSRRCCTRRPWRGSSA